MANTLEFYQNENKEAIEFTFTNANDGSDIDISGTKTSVIEFRVFSQDYSTLLCEGNLVDTKIVKTGGAGSNTCEFRPANTDYSAIGLYKTELRTVFDDGREDKNQNLLIRIKQKAPIT